MPNDYSRRSSQTTLKIILENFIKLIAPILPFTADEAYAYLQNENELDHKPIALETWPIYNPKWQFTEIAKDINGLLKFLNNKLNEKLEDLRQKKIIGQSLDAEVSIKGPSKNEEIMLLIKYQSELEELFILSKVNVIIDDNINDIELDVKHAEGEKCPRSWRWVDNLESTPNWGYVSPRCKEVHNKLYKS